MFVYFITLFFWSLGLLCVLEFSGLVKIRNFGREKQSVAQEKKKKERERHRERDRETERERERARAARRVCCSLCLVRQLFDFNFHTDGGAFAYCFLFFLSHFALL